ncbi:MAG: lipopolysaccharide kinase InaA family protein [Deltaproteobacteria bacterium]|nr:lipopolysaccharide kinase InaA family protein [Deltaproteobacteria bacterium]
MKTTPNPGDEPGAIHGKGWRVAFRKEFSAYFPATLFADYAAFVGARGKVLKLERRTRIVLLRLAVGAAEADEQRFILKEYRFPFAPRIRTWLRIAKAEQEFNGLLHLHRLGVQAVEPVGFGLQRSRFGFVRSCFLMTIFVEDALDLKEWSREEERATPGPRPGSGEVFRRIGEAFRRCHAARFFLFTGKPKNILMRRKGAEQPEPFFIDVPYARSLPTRPLSRWAQGRDLGMFLGGFPPGSLTRGDQDAFYEGYLPDPLRASPDALRRRVERAMLASQNRTLLSALVHRGKRVVRKFLGIRTASSIKG